MIMKMKNGKIKRTLLENFADKGNRIAKRNRLLLWVLLSIQIIQGRHTKCLCINKFIFAFQVQCV